MSSFEDLQGTYQGAVLREVKLMLPSSFHIPRIQYTLELYDYQVPEKRKRKTFAQHFEIHSRISKYSKRCVCASVSGKLRRGGAGRAGTGERKKGQRAW